MADNLEAYNKKRNFDKTGEPEGALETPGERLRFVVQRHAARADHYDFRLEWDGALLSWAVPKGPSYNTRDKRLAIRVEDHPLEYRNFEGTIPKGEYGGGDVMLWDEGTWEPQFDAGKGLAEGSLKIILYGRRLQGKWALVRLKPKAGEDKENWLLIKERDEYARADDGISAFTTSVRTGRTMAEIDAGEDEKITKNPFDRADVQLAKLVNAAPEGDEWLYELKYDGYRILAFLEGDAVRLVTRNGNDYTKRFQAAAAALAGWAAGRAMVLDGEMIVADAGGRPNFQALQNYMKNPGKQNLAYVVFDLLALDGKDLRGEKLTARKEALKALMADAPKDISYSEHVAGNGKENFEAACRAKLEGVVGKKADSVYSGTRNGDWIKLKCETRQEFVIGGYTRTEKKTSGISALLLGVYTHGGFVYVGRAGTGLSERSARELEEKFAGIKRDAPPFAQAPKGRTNEEVTWLEPALVAEIKFAEWTGDNQLRQASFKGLRADKDPRDVIREFADDRTAPDDNQAAGNKPQKEMEAPMNKDGSITIDGVRVTNPQKVMFDDIGITKEDVVRYYEAVSGRMLPYVSRRILSIVRCPKGIAEACFFKKHPGPGSKGIVTVTVPSSEGEPEEYFYIESAEGLMSEAQMGTLEFHTWGSRADALETPDMMVFDLDPDAGMDLAQVRQGVKDLKSVLDELSLVSYLKTSGGKGYHIVLPFVPAAGWEAFHDFARRIAEVMEQKWPERYTSNVRKEKRKNKIFIDWLRNGRGATSVAPYSLRARKGASVSMPIAWDELDTAAPNGIHMADALERINSADPWEGFFKTEQRLKTLAGV